MGCRAELSCGSSIGVGGLKGAPSSGYVSSFPFQSFCDGPWREERIWGIRQDHTDPRTVSNFSPFQPKIQEGVIHLIVLKYVLQSTSKINQQKTQPKYFP